MQDRDTPERVLTPLDRLAKHLEDQLMREVGPLLVGEDLRRALGYRSLASLHQAIKRHTVPVPLFNIEKRRGKYALTTDVAKWLAETRATVPLTVVGTEQD